MSRKEFLYGQAFIKLQDGGEKALGKYLKETKGDINTFDGRFTLLQSRVLSRHPEPVKALLNLGADSLLPSKSNGANALHLAAHKKRANHLTLMLTQLKKQGKLEEALKSTDEEGNTPLHRSAMSGGKEAVEVLLEFGADPTLLNKKQSSAIDVALDANKGEIADLLMHHSRESDTGSSNSNTNSSNNSLEDLNSSGDGKREGLNYDIDSPTACLLEAVQKGDLEGVKQAIRQNADIDVCVNGNCRTPLVSAMGWKFEKIAYYLLTQGANPEIPSSKGGLTPLHFAAGYGFNDVIKLMLLDSRTQLDAVSMDQGLGITPLHSAVTRNQLETIKLLIESGADPSIRTVEGNATALEMAESEGFNEIADYLRSLPKVKPTSQLASKNGNKISEAITQSRKSSGILADVSNNHYEELENLKGQKKCVVM